jgi:hypothetical protein
MAWTRSAGQVNGGLTIKQLYEIFKEFREVRWDEPVTE